MIEYNKLLHEHTYLESAIQELHRGGNYDKVREDLKVRVDTLVEKLSLLAESIKKPSR